MHNKQGDLKASVFFSSYFSRSGNSGSIYWAMYYFQALWEAGANKKKPREKNEVTAGESVMFNQLLYSKNVI